MLHQTSEERYKKLKRVFERLKEDFNRDDLDDFIQTANSLREWIRSDKALTQDQRAALERFVVPESIDWQICNQIANQQKHVGRSKPRTRRRSVDADVIPEVVAVVSTSGGRGFFNRETAKIIGSGEEITIHCGEARESGLAFAIRVFEHFHYIFEVAPIPLQQRPLLELMSDILG